MIHPKELSALLRDKSRWPAGFKWNFYDCNHCAMGLMSDVWNVNARSPERAATALGIPVSIALEIFGGRTLHGGFTRTHSPEDIAADLEALVCDD